MLRRADPAGLRAVFWEGPALTARTWWAAGGMAALAAAGYLGGVAGLGPLPAPAHAPWWLLAIAFALTELLVVRYREDRTDATLSLTGLVLVPGLVFTGPGELLAARLAGVVVALVILERQSVPRAALAVSHRILGTVAAIVVFRDVLGSSSPVSERGWVAALAACATATLVSWAAVGAASAIRGASLARWRPDVLAATAAEVVVNTGLGVVAVLLAWRNPDALWVLAVPVASVFAVARALSQLQQRYAKLASLYDFTAAVSGSLEGEPVAGIMLSRARQILACEQAELALLTGHGRLRCTTVGESGKAITASRALDPGGLEAHVLGTGEAVLASLSSARRLDLRAPLEARGLREAMVAPLRDREGHLGTLLVANHAGRDTALDKGDLKLFESLANHASVALQNDSLLVQLRQEAAEREHRALHDSLTGLPNRTLFAQRVDQAITTAHGCTGLLLVDLDRFKEVNDTLGHQNGDVILVEAGGRLTRALGGRGMVARLGGDEFAVMLPNLTGPEQAMAVAEELKAAMLEPYELEAVTFEVSASVGVALHPAHGADAATLLQRADVAMYAAKAAHGDTQLYTPEHDDYTPRRLALVGELRRAIEEEELTVHYQPVASLETGEVVGVEALLRWPHQHHGFLPPDEFVPIAEHTGLIRPLTDFVLRSALRQSAHWRARGLALRVAVNISARNLLDPELPDRIEALLEGSGVPPDGLVLEITESGIMSDLDNTMGVLSRVSDTGVGLAVDDFGTGHSSLSYLQRLPVDEVKIDKSFILYMSTHPGDAVIVRSTVGLAHSLGLGVIAEGVENRDTWERLQSLGCDLAQGYLLSRPMPAARVEEWVYSQSQPRGPAEVRQAARQSLRVVREQPAGSN